MKLFFPLKEALSTPVGDMLIFLTISLVVVFCFYLYFWFRFARQKDLTKCHHLTFTRTEKLMTHLEFKGLATSNFFGKKQVVSMANGQYGQCLIFYPELSSPDISRRFQDYHMLLQRVGLPFFPNNLVYFENNQLVNVGTQFMQANGETLINFAQYSLDTTLSDAEKENFLVDVAYMLEALHQLKTESGESLYHGFLLPSSFYFSINIVKKITNIYLSEYGCAFALGAQGFQDWISDILQGKYILDSMEKMHIVNNEFIFSPEQRSKGAEITSATDFYSYAALSVYIFTQQQFSSVDEINWELVPKGWRVFLKQCLNVDPKYRPINFLELKEYFNDPDLEIESSRADDESKLSTQASGLNSIKSYFDQVQQNRQDSLVFDELWHEGFLAIKESNWDKAHKIFGAMLKEDQNSFDAHLGLALLFYQKGQEKEAKEHYLEAKKIDAKRIGCFHKLIAFDI